MPYPDAMGETNTIERAATGYGEQFPEDASEARALFDDAFKSLRHVRLPRGMPAAASRQMQTPPGYGAERIDRRDRWRTFWLDRGPRRWLKQIERPLARFREAARRCHEPLSSFKDVQAGRGFADEDLANFCWLAQLAEISARRMIGRKQFEWAWHLLLDLVRACHALRTGAPAHQAMMLNTAEARLLRELRRWADRKKNTSELLRAACEEFDELLTPSRAGDEQQHAAFLQKQSPGHEDLERSFQRLATDRQATAAYLLVSTFRQRNGFYPNELATVGEEMEVELPKDPFAPQPATFHWRISSGERLSGWGVDAPGRKLRTRHGQPLLYSVAADAEDSGGGQVWNGTPKGEGNWFFPLPAQKNRRRWFQFDLRSFLIVFTLVALAMAYFSSPAAQQKRAIRLIERAGGTVEYEEVDPTSTRAALIDWFGYERFGRVTTVSLSDVQPNRAAISSLKNFPHLRSLQLGSSDFNDDHLAMLKNMTQLESLSVSYTKIKGPGLVHLVGLPNLRDIDLDSSELNDEGLKHLGKMRQLESLDIRSTQITDEGLKKMPAMPQLDHLYLLDVPITDDSLAWVGKCPNLVHVDVDGSQVKGPGLAHLKGLKSLETLDIRNTQLEHDALKHLPTLPSLNTIMVSNTQVGDASMPHLARQQKLAYLQAGQTNIGDAELMELTKMPALISVDLEETRVSQFGAWWLQNSKTFEEFSWSQRAASGPGLLGPSWLPTSLTRAVWSLIAPFQNQQQADFLEFDESDWNGSPPPELELLPR